MKSRSHENSGDTSSNPESFPNPLIERFRDLVDATVFANGSKPDSSGISRFVLSHDGWTINFIDFGPEPQGMGKQILWTSFQPTFGIDVKVGNGTEYLFAAADGDDTAIHRRYKYGSLLGNGRGLPNLFTSERELDEAQTRSLISYVEAPHLYFNDLHQLLFLEPEECAELEISNKRVAEQSRILHADLRELRRWHTPRGNIE